MDFFKYGEIKIFVLSSFAEVANFWRLVMWGLKGVYALRHHLGNRRWHSGEILGRSRAVLKNSWSCLHKMEVFLHLRKRCM